MQLEFSLMDEAAIEARLEQLCDAPVDLRLTDNASTMMSYKSATPRGPLRLRVHRMFLNAPPEVIDSLAQWALGRRSRKVCRPLDQFIAANRHLIRHKPLAERNLVTSGRFHDLQAYYDLVNAHHFDRAINAPITWGKFPPARCRRTIRLGSYTPGDHIIRVHPHLDQAFVPDYFVRYIVFHEMLHAELGIEETADGRRRIHTREFNRRERAYPEYKRAIAWHDEPANLRRLMRRIPKSA